jgi:hypothetical protein
MKLTDKQLQILVDSIYKENFQSLINKEREQYKEQLKVVTKEELKVIKNYVEACQAYDKLLKRSDRYMSEKYVMESFINERRYNLEHKFKSKYPTRQEVESAVVLATIDANDINQLIKAVKTKFKLK